MVESVSQVAAREALSGRKGGARMAHKEALFMLDCKSEAEGQWGLLSIKGKQGIEGNHQQKRVALLLFLNKRAPPKNLYSAGEVHSEVCALERGCSCRCRV